MRVLGEKKPSVEAVSVAEGERLELGLHQGGMHGEGGSQVLLSEDFEVFAGEDSCAEGEVVDLDSEAGGALGGGPGGVGVVDVHLGGDERRADGHDAAFAGGELDDEEFAFGDGEAPADEGIVGSVGIVDQQSEDRAVNGALNAEAEDADGLVFKQAGDAEELAEPVFEEDGELSAGRVVATLESFQRLDAHHVRHPYSMKVDCGCGM